MNDHNPLPVCLKILLPQRLAGMPILAPCMMPRCRVERPFIFKPFAASFHMLAPAPLVKPFNSYFPKFDQIQSASLPLSWTVKIHQQSALNNPTGMPNFKESVRSVCWLMLFAGSSSSYLATERRRSRKRLTPVCLALPLFPPFKSLGCTALIELRFLTQGGF